MRASATPVSPLDSSAPERILGEDGGRAYRRFLAWTVGDGFAMAVIEVRSPRSRRELLAWTTAEMPDTHVIALDEASGRPLWPLFERACPSPGATDVLVLTRLEDAVNRIKLCARINIQRDELARAFPVPWVILVHPAAALEMQQYAPDFSDFAGLWLNEEPEEKATHLEALASLGSASRSIAAPAMHLAADDGSSDLLDDAYNAALLSKYDEAADLLAQYDMHHPDVRALEPRRIRLDGILLWMHGDSAKALDRLEEALRLCAPSSDIQMRAGLLSDIAHIRAQNGEVDDALDLHKQALEVYEKEGDRRSRAAVLGDIARLRADKGEADAALDLNRQALAIYEELGDRRSRAVAMGDIARILADRGEIDAALDLHKQALEVYETLGDHYSRAVALNDIGLLCADKGEVDVALDLHQQALEIHEKLGTPDGIATAHWSMGQIAFRQGDMNAAIDHLSTSYTISNRLGRLDAICIVGFNLAQVLLAAGRRLDAIPILVFSRDGFLRLGRLKDAQRVQTLIDSTSDNP